MILALLSQATRDDSDEPAHLSTQSHQSHRCMHTKSIEVDEGTDKNLVILTYWKAELTRLKYNFKHMRTE